MKPAPRRIPRVPLAACVVLRDEAPYLREWLEFHKLSGFRHFYLYYLGSRDTTRNVVAPYVARGEATLFRRRDGLHASVAAFNHCLELVGPGAGWIAFLTLDDYLFGAYEDDLRRVLSGLSACSGISVECTAFGQCPDTTGRAPLVERHKERVNRARKVRRMIVNMRFAPLRAITAGHFVRLAPSGSMVPISLSLPLVSSGEAGKRRWVPRLRINHYLFRPVEALLRRRALRAAEEATLIRAFAADYPLRGQVDLAVQRFVPRLRQRLGLPPGRKPSPLQIEADTADRYRREGGSRAPDRRRSTPPREITVIGMQRSGNHAVIQWLLSGLRGRWIFVNGVTVGSDPFECAGRSSWPGPGYGTYEPALLRSPGRLRSFTGRLVFSLEEYSPEVAGAWLKREGPFVAKKGDRVTLLILRDPANLFASRLRKEEWGAAGSCGWIPFDRLHCQLARDRWIEHALEFTGQTRHLPNLVPIDYVQFVRSGSYRARLAASLGIKPDKAVLARVPARGGGSSFDELRLDGRAGRMRVFDRWRHYADHPLYREIVGDPRLRLLSELIFGPAPEQ